MSESIEGQSEGRDQQLIAKIDELQRNNGGGFWNKGVQHLGTAVLGGPVTLAVATVLGLLGSWVVEGGPVRLMGGWSRGDITEAVKIWDCTEYVGAY